MITLGKRVGICCLIVVCFWMGTVLADRNRLNEELIRLHVVANSDSEEDQSIKRMVRDAVTESLQEDLEKIADVEQARRYLQDNLPKIEAIANAALKALGTDQKAVATICKEAFDTRYYDTFALPSGIYEALRITIGEGDGKNWWCVVFPTLCVPATCAGFEDVAAGAGFPNLLSDTLTDPEEYQIRFLALDLLGKMESLLMEG